MKTNNTNHEGFLSNLDEARGKFIAVFISIEEELKDIIAGAISESNNTQNRIKGIFLNGLGASNILTIFGDLISLASTTTEEWDILKRLKKINSYRNLFAHCSILQTRSGFIFTRDDKTENAPNLVLNNGQSFTEDWYQGTLIEMMQIYNRLRNDRKSISDKIRTAIDTQFDPS